MLYGYQTNTLRSGAGAPTAIVGQNGDFYIDTVVYDIFGPKAGGVWPAGVSLVGSAGPAGADGADGAAGPAGPAGADGADGADGPAGPAGADGADGADGTNGTNGNTVLNGAADPVAGTGVNGDFYINTTSYDIFGPKAGGDWPAGVSLIGPAQRSIYPVTQIDEGDCPYTVQDADEAIEVDLTGAGGGPYSIILPSLAASLGRRIMFARIDNEGAVSCTINRAGADVIDWMDTSKNLPSKMTRTLMGYSNSWVQPM